MEKEYFFIVIYKLMMQIQQKIVVDKNEKEEWGS